MPVSVNTQNALLLNAANKNKMGCRISKLNVAAHS